MANIGDLEKLNPGVVLGFVTWLISIFVPGFLLMYVFKQQLFFSLDLFRLTVLAMAIVSPVYMLNFLWVYYYNIKDQLKKIKENPNPTTRTSMALSLILSAVVSIPVIYIPIGIGYFIKMNFKTVIWIMISIEFVMFLALFLFNAAVHMVNDKKETKLPVDHGQHKHKQK